MTRNIALDILRVLMAFMVIGIHTHFLHDISVPGEYLTVNGLFRIAVPVFLMINGFYFYPVVENAKHRTWLKRIVLLYIVWMLFYAYAWIDVPDLSFTSMMKLVHRMIFGYLHLWYIAGLIGAAVLFLYLRRFSSFWIWFSIVLTFSAGVFIEYAHNYAFFHNSLFSRLATYDWIHRNFLFLSYPFFALGYMIHKHMLHRKITLDMAMAMSVIGLIALLTESYLNYLKQECDNLIAVIFLTPALFILFLKVDIRGSSKQLALYASAIFFIHIFFVNIFVQYTDLHETVMTFAVFFSSLVSAFFILKLHKKVKFIL